MAAPAPPVPETLTGLYAYYTRILGSKCIPLRFTAAVHAALQAERLVFVLRSSVVHLAGTSERTAFEGFELFKNVTNGPLRQTSRRGPCLSRE